MTRTVNKFHVSSKLKYLKRIIFEWISRDAYCKRILHCIHCMPFRLRKCLQTLETNSNEVHHMYLLIAPKQQHYI